MKTLSPMEGEGGRESPVQLYVGSSAPLLPVIVNHLVSTDNLVSVNPRGPHVDKL